MLKEIFPASLADLIYDKFNINGIYEIRVRADKPLYVNYYGEYLPLRNSSQSLIFADRKLIDYIINHVTEMSVYRYNTQIQQGFITTKTGIRIGLGGEVVLEENQGVKTIKNISSMVLRVPHEIKNCALDIMPFIVDKCGVKNTLILSPPGCGKTTIIRDIARQLGFQERMYNTLIVDERYEIAGAENGSARMDVGLSTDVLSGGTKMFGFSSGVRCLRPDVIITDEIGKKTDAQAIKQAMLSGVNVIATAHAKDLEELKKRSFFIDLLQDKVFSRFVVLSNAKGVGTIEAIYNSNLELVKEYDLSIL